MVPTVNPTCSSPSFSPPGRRFDARKEVFPGGGGGVGFVGDWGGRGVGGGGLVGGVGGVGGGGGGVGGGWGCVKAVSHPAGRVVPVLQVRARTSSFVKQCGDGLMFLIAPL